MKRTEKSEANSRQDKIMANGRQEKSIANGRQSKPKDGDKAKYDAKHITVVSCSQPPPKHPRTDADVQQGQYELKLDEGDHPNHRLHRGNRGVQERKLSRKLRSTDSESPDMCDQRSLTYYSRQKDYIFFELISILHTLWWS